MDTKRRPPVVNVYLDDDGEQLIVRERMPDGGARERRIPAEYVTWHKADDLGRERMRQLKGLSTVKGIREVGSWVRVSWDGDDARRGGRDGMKENEVATYEGDLDPAMLWLVETRVEIAKPRRCYLDLECDSRVALANKEGMRVLSWAVVDHETGEEFTDVIREESDAEEERCLAKLVKLLERYDQIAVWEGDWRGGEFDSVVLPARCRRQGIDFDERRWLWLNQLAVWKRMNMHSAESGAEKESFKLEDIAHEQIGEGKEPIPDFVRERFGEKASRGLGAMTWDLWEADGEYRELLVRYNARDAQILRKLEQRKQFITLFQALCEVCGIVPVTKSLHPTKQMDGFLLRLGREHDYRFPTKSFRDEVDEEEDQFRGALVIRPKTVEGDDWTEHQAREWRTEHGMRNGVLRNVHVCDFASLYPSVMRTFNLSAEVVVGRAKSIEAARRQHGEAVCRSPGTDLVTRVDVIGFLPLAFRELIRLRKQYADLAASLPPGSPEWADAMSKSTAYKVAANSFYGAGGSKYSRFNNRDVSEACTQNAVHFLKITAAEAEARKMVLAYGDSVTGERTVVVKDARGHVQMVPIERLFSLSTSLYESRGKEFGDLDGWMALTEKGWRVIRSIVRHLASKSVHTITTKHGQTRVTSDHGIMVGGQEERPVDFVAQGMRFENVRAPRPEPAERIDLLEYLLDASYSMEIRGELRALKFVADGVEHIALSGTEFRRRSPKIRRFYDRGSEELRSLVRLVGAYASDGSASIRGRATRSLLSFCKSDLGWMQRIAADLGRVFDGTVTGPMWTETTWVVRSGTHAMACLFDALCGSGSKRKRLPPFAFDLDDDAFDVLYESFERGDGYVEDCGELRFSTTSAELAAGVSYVLSQRAIDHGFGHRESKGEWTIRTRKGKERPGRYSIKHRVDVDYDGYVYDLTVDDAHTFVDGIGRVLLHNTDSVFTFGPTEEGYRRFVGWLNANRFPKEVETHGCRENHIKLAFEKTFERLVFVSAKAYIGRFSQYKGTPAKRECHGAEFKHDEECPTCGGKGRLSGEPEIKGLAWKRGDKGRLARELQGRIIDCLVGGVKLRAPGGKKEWINRDLGIETPTEDPDVYRQIVKRACDHVLEDTLPIAEVRFAKGLSKSLREYTKDATEVHVRVARVLKERGQSMGKGTKVEYVVVDASSTPQIAIPAEDYVGECDRFYLWERVYSPTQSLLIAAFPDLKSEWEALGKVRPPKLRKGKERPGQLGLAIGVPQRPKHDPLDELAVPAYRATPLVVRVPESAGKEAIDRVIAACAKHPGARTMTVVISLDSGGEAVIPTTIRVSPGPAFRASIEEAIAPEEEIAS